jgi:hypothetical protein
LLGEADASELLSLVELLPVVLFSIVPLFGVSVVESGSSIPSFAESFLLSSSSVGVVVYCICLQ